MNDPSPEVIIVGGGPAGSAAALALARGGRRAVLIDELRSSSFRIGEALAPAGRPLLRDLGVLDRFLSDGHLPCYGNLSAWGSRELSMTDFIHNINGHGWHLDRACFDALLRWAAADSGAEVRESRVKRVSRDGEEWRVELAGGAGEELRCAWILDATGRASAIARRCGATRLYNDGLTAFAGRFRPPAPLGERSDRDARTLIEAAPDGWWYTALVPSGERVVAYMVDADLADRSALLSVEGFLAAIDSTEHVRAVLRGYSYSLADRPRGADASSARLERFAGPGWVSAGDAAISFDPLSSQGILTALYTGLRAGQALAAILAGERGALADYVHRLEQIHAAYIENYTTYYALEARFRDRPFWRRRLGGS